jgi:hypothetical protein
MAWSRLCPSIAEHPEPGWRLLHGVVTSWKYLQRVRCRGSRRWWPGYAADRGAGQYRLRERGVALQDGWVGGEVAVFDHRADPYCATRQHVDGVDGQSRHVDQQLGAQQPELKVIDKVGTTAEETARGRAARVATAESASVARW